MNAERWEHVQRLFEEALEGSPDERVALLARIRETDPDLLHDVQRLLVAHDEAGSFLSHPAAADEPSRFVEGDLVAGRYRITRFIARGGMGEVYEAQDMDLQERVALKTLRAEAAREGRGGERFKREILMARKVTHPNVCRIFEFGVHRSADGHDQAFLTMELLAGETLADHLKRRGRVPTGEARSIAEQMAAGLEAAHQVGIVHRDFKTGNVILVPTPAGARAVVTDFGLARTATTVDGSTTGRLAGTPDYMAPEQLEGKPATPQTDIYALGLVLYELVTGTRPFAGDNALAAAVKRLKDPVRPPRELTRGLDPRWNAVILRCLARDPAARFRSAADVATGLRQGTPRWRRLGRREAALVAVLLAMGGTLAVLQHRTSAPTPAAPETPRSITRRSVAVLGFRNLAGRTPSAWLSPAFAEMLTSELGAGERLRTIPGAQIAQAKADLGLGDEERYAQDVLDRLRRRLGADVFVLGSYVAVPAGATTKIRFDVSVQEAASGGALAVLNESGTEAELLDLVSRLGVALRGKLGVGALSASAAEGLQATRPANVDAARSYAEGLDKLRRLDLLEARSLLERTVELDPAFALAYFHLASAYRDLGEGAKGRQASRRALDLATRLSREDRLAVEALDRELAGDPKGALQIYETLFRFFPDNLEYGLNLLRLNATLEEANATIALLRKLPPPAGQDIRIDLEEAELVAYPDYERLLGAASRAVGRARSLGARSLLATALSSKGKLLLFHGQPDRAEEALQEALSVFEERGDMVGVAYTTQRLSNQRAVLGRLSEAQRFLERTQEVAERLDHRARRVEALFMSSELKLLSGDPGAALRLLDRATSLAQGFVTGGARSWVRQAIGRVHRVEGNLAQARRICDEAQPWGPNDWSPEKLDLARVLLDQGEAREARHLLRRALSGQQGIRSMLGAADAAIHLAESEIEAGDAPAAEQRARQTATTMGRCNYRVLEAEATAVLARAMIEQGRPRDALDAIEGLRPRAPEEHRLAMIALGTEEARARGRAGEAGRALRDARTVLAEARRRGLIGLAVRAELVVAEIERTAGEGAQSRERLARVEREARSRGYLSLAQRARPAPSP